MPSFVTLHLGDMRPARVNVAAICSGYQSAPVASDAFMNGVEDLPVQEREP